MVSCHVIENQEIGFKKFGTEPRRVVGLHQILDGNVTHNYYLLGTTTNLSMLFQALGLWLHLTEVPYSSKFLWHKNFVKHSKLAKLLIFVVKFS